MLRHCFLKGIDWRKDHRSNVCNGGGKVQQSTSEIPQLSDTQRSISERVQVMHLQLKSTIYTGKGISDTGQPTGASRQEGEALVI